MKVYYTTLVMLENKEVMFETRGTMPITVEEESLLEQDIGELKTTILSLRRVIASAYGVEVFTDAASEVLRYIQEDPYHRLMLSLHGSDGDMSMKAIDGGLSIWGVSKPPEIN